MTTFAAPRVAHHFTVDVEEYFHVSAMEPYVERSAWEGMPSRVDASTRTLLDLLAAHDARGTFFVLGWVAERHPALVRDIAEAGHEVASHGHAHERITQLTPEQFRESVRVSKQILEQLIGQAVLGYRAPSFSILRGMEWSFDVLLEEGYRYDSSLYPVRRSGSGFVGGKRDPHPISRSGGTLHEFPPATLKVGPRVFAAGGGAYLRHLPYLLVDGALASAERRGVPATIYIHPWEVDPAQPRIAVNAVTRLRHYGGLSRTLPRLARMLGDYRFQPIATTLAAAGAPSVPRAALAGA